MHQTMTGGEGRRAEEPQERGNACWKQANHAGAIEWLTRALMVDPDDAQSLLRRGAAEAAISDIAGAADDLGRARAMLPGGGGQSRRYWASAQLGEGIRNAVRDAAATPDAGAAGAQALLVEMDASIAAFTEALGEDPRSAWAHAHRGAVAVLAHWLGGRLGVDPDRVAQYAASASSDLAAALHLNSTYKWALVFQAILHTLQGSNAPNGPERRALFASAAGRVKEAGRADESFVVLRPLVEFALYNRDHAEVVELGFAQLARDPDDTITRYCVAAALARIAGEEREGEPAVAAARRASAQAFGGQAERALLAKRSRTAGMLGGLAMLDGKLDVAARMLEDVIEYPDMDTLVFMKCDPAWGPAREPASGETDDPRFAAVKAAYARLFPPAP
jgi:tetratricopeptide (TPR) repeat protein